MKTTHLALLIAFAVVAQLPAQQRPVTDPPEMEAPEAPEMEEEEEEEEIETDRDSFTPAATVTARGRLITEAAYSFIDNRRVAETHSFPELLLRYGVNEWIEARLGWNYEVGGVGSPVSGNVPSDFDDGEIEEESRILYGLKAYVTSQDEWRPKSVVILQGFTPTSGEATDSQFSATYVVGWQFNEGWQWDSGLRYSTADEREDNFNVWAASSVLKIPLGERWKAHVEYFGIFSAGREAETVQHFFSPGAHYLINEDLEVGVRVGWGLNDQSANFFANVGLGWRY